MEIYDILKKEYENLSDEEKYLLLVYKSSVSNIINDIDNKNNIEKYNILKKDVSNIINLFAKNTIYKDINFNSYETFIDSIKVISDKINDIKNKIVLPSNITVYRATTVNNISEIYDISKSNIISTSLDMDVTNKFYTNNGINVLYEINLEKNTPCLIIPYSIKKINNLIKIVNDDNQSEIILFKDTFSYDINFNVENDVVNVKVDTKLIKELNY